MAVYSQALRDALQAAQTALLPHIDVLLAYELNRARPHILRLRSRSLPGNVSAYSFENESQLMELLFCFIAEAEGKTVAYPSLTEYEPSAPIITPPRVRKRRTSKEIAAGVESSADAALT